MDNNILELDDKMLFIKFAYFSFTKAEVTWDSNCFFFRLWRHGTSDLLTANAFVSFLVFLIFSTFCGPNDIFVFSV